MTKAQETVAQLLIAGIVRGALKRDRPGLGQVEMEQAVANGVKLMTDAGAYLKGGKLYLPNTQ